MSLNDDLNKWAKENADVFQRHGLTSSKLTISKGGMLWKPPQIKIPDDYHHPGFDFFNSPPYMIIRNFSYPKPETHSEGEPKYIYYNFDESKIPEERPTSIEKILKLSPPLVSMFQNLEIGPIMDQRADVGMLKPGPLNYYCAKFLRLSSSAVLIEPIIVNVFLWDLDKKKKLSETWRFFPESESFDSNIKGLIVESIVKAPLEMNIPYTTHHNRIIIVISLDRLLMRNAGSSFAKYYEKSNSSSKSAAVADLKACDQPKTTITFAWAYQSMNEVIPTGDPVKRVFSNFQYTQSVSDNFLDEYFSQQPKEKIVPFEVAFEFSNESLSAGKLKYYFNFPISPYNSFINELIIHPICAHLKPPRGITARTILAEIEIRSNRKPLPLFNGETTYTTRCQYHVESPSFSEDIVVELPYDLPRDTQIHVQFLHCSVKPKSKRVRSPCGVAIYPLFRGGQGTFIEDSVHKAGISYANNADDIVAGTESNVFMFQTILRSSIYTSDLQVAKIFKGTLNNIRPPPSNLLLPHLYGVLDVILNAINFDDADGFNALINILSDFHCDRSDSQFLIYYLKFCALRHDGEKEFHRKLLPMWLRYLNETPFSHKRSDFFCCWFLFELLVKSMIMDQEQVDYPSIVTLTSTLSGYLPNFRDAGQSIGKVLNKHLCLFYKDIFEFVENHGIVIEMSRMHLENIECDAQKNLFDRECLRDFILTFLSPKIFLYVIAPLSDGTSVFSRHFLPLIESGFGFCEHTNDVFKLLFNLLLQYEPKEHRIIAPLLLPLLLMLGRCDAIMKEYPSKSLIVYPLVIAHYILYYIDLKDFGEDMGNTCQTLLLEAQKLKKIDIDKVNEFGKKVGTPENITQTITSGLRDAEGTIPVGGFGQQPPQQAKTRKFASLKMLQRSEMFKTQVNTNSDIEKTFEALTFCLQALTLDLALKFQNVFALNSIISTLCNVKIAPLLVPFYNSTLTTFVDKSPDIVFGDPSSNIKHIIRRMVADIDQGKLDLLNKCIEYETKKYGMPIRTRSMIVRAFLKEKPSEEVVELCKESSFGTFVKKLFDLNKDLSSQELKNDNSDVYSDLLFRKAELVSFSPDSRVETLLELNSYHIETQYFSEAVITQLTAAALVAEYLGRLGKIPNYFNDQSPAKMFCVACPSAVSEVCTDEILAHLPKIRGYCTSKYFTEYGLIYLIMGAMATCKRASLFELSTKIHSLLSPIAEFRHLWHLMKMHYVGGSFAWRVISQFTTTSDRSLGCYYKVQFQTGETYIYRETNYANIWEIRDRLMKTSVYMSGGKEVVVVNEGDELPPVEKLDAAKFYIHIKAVAQYFTSAERKSRITVFEQNHNIDKFYFDIPFSKTSQTSIEHCCLKRKIIRLPHPLPYIVKRVLIPPENITEEIFSPIAYSCQNIQKQVDLIEEACVMKDYKKLQPLIQGSLLVTVNEGPQKIAEVFLGRGEGNPKYQSRLRSIFREFLKSNAKAVLLHAEYVKTNSVYALLQEELEAGLNRLNSTLQPYLK